MTFLITGKQVKALSVSTTVVLIAILSIATILFVPQQSSQAADHSRNIGIEITAKVSFVQDFSNLLNEAVNVGDTITGKYVYDLLAKDSNLDKTVGDYQHITGTYGIALQTGNLVFRTDPNNVNFIVELVNRDKDDHYLLISRNNLPVSSDVLVDSISWQLDDDTGNALSTASLVNAPIPPKLNKWTDSFGLTITGFASPEGPEPEPGQDQYFIRAHVVSAKFVKN